MSIIPLKNLLPIAINKAGIKKQVEAAQICAEYEKIIKSLKQKNLEKSKPLNYKNKVLTISIPSSGHAQELLMCQHIIKKKINNFFDQELIERIQYRIEF